MRYRVRHFGHSTQWRIRNTTNTPMESSGTPIHASSLVPKMVGSNTHLTGFGHNHYDPRNEEGSFRDSSDDRGQPEGPEGSSSADL